MSNILRDPVLKMILVAAVICFIVSVALSMAVSGENALVRFDKHAANTIFGHRWEWLDEVFEIITEFGSIGVVVVAAAAGVWLLAHKQWLPLAIGIAAIGGGKGVNVIVKDLIARQRPVFPHPELTPKELSFPSGHAMMSIIAYGFVAYLLWPRLHSRRARAALVLGTTLLVLLIGFSRLYLGVHYPTDVIAGYTIGGTWLLLWLGVLEVVRRV